MGYSMKAYAIHSTARAVTTRTIRYAAASHRGLKQYVLPQQYRLVRGRPVLITEEELMANLPELREKSDAGLLEVRMAHGDRLVDLTSLEAGPADVSPPKPNPPLDSVARDTQNIGERMPSFPGGPVPPAFVMGEAAKNLPPEADEESDLEVLGDDAQMLPPAFPGSESGELEHIERPKAPKGKGGKK